MSPPRKRDDSVIRLIKELGERPAMNGGFQRLAQQQEEQLVRLTKLEERLEPVEEWVSSLTRWGKWVLGGIGAILVTVLGELLVNILTHLHVSMQ